MGLGSSTGGLGWGTTSTVKVAQTFTPTFTADVCCIRVKLSKTGSPTDNIECKIYTDGTTEPGTLVATSTNTVAGTDLTTSLVEKTFDFSTGDNLTGATKYWVVFSRTGSTSNTNYYKILYETKTSQFYTGGSLWGYSTLWEEYDYAYWGEYIHISFSEFYYCPPPHMVLTSGTIFDESKVGSIYRLPR